MYSVGPMLAKRAYAIYLRCCGIKKMDQDLKLHMNRALQQATNEKRVFKDDEWGSGVYFTQSFDCQTKIPRSFVNWAIERLNKYPRVK